MKNALLNYFEDRLENRAGDHQCVVLELSELRESLTWLKLEAGFIYLVDFTALDQGPQSPERFVLKYLLLNLEEHFRLQVEVPLKESQIQSLIDVSDLWPSVVWPQREVWDMFGLALGHKKQDRLFNPEVFKGHPLRKDFKAEKIDPEYWPSQSETFVEKQSVRAEHIAPVWSSIGPAPIGNSLFKLNYRMKENSIDKVKVEFGYAHRGLEKICESKKYLAATEIVQKLNSTSGELSRLSWIRTLEKLAGVSLPERAQAMRMAYIEISRIQDHLANLSYALKEAGLVDMYDLVQLQRERFYVLWQDHCLKRVNTQLICFGGVSQDLPIGWLTKCLDCLAHAQKVVSKVKSCLIRSSQWMEKTKCAKVRPFEALQWGFSGPALRACGVNYDLRKTNPFYFYSDVDFQIPLGINGDSYDRFLVRIEEIDQSIGILNQILDLLPAGPFYEHEQVEILKPPGKNYIELPAGENYSAIESANGELGVGLVSKGGDQAYRVRLRSPAYFLAQSLNKVLLDQDVSQALMTVHSLNLIHTEVDK